MSTHYDAVVLGTGNAGTAAADSLVKAGWKVAIVESWDVGGTCALRGCVPKKVLVAAAEALDAIARAGAHGIEVGPPRLDWAALIDRELGFIEDFPEKLEASLVKRGIDVIHGHGRFVGHSELHVDGRTLSARKVVVAVGAEPRPLPFDGADHLTTSARFLRMRERAESVAFVGAGVIAFEFAHVLVRAGTRVTMLEVAEQPLGGLEASVVDRLLERTRALGVEVRTGVRVTGVGEQEGRFVVSYEEGDTQHRLEVDRVIHGAGRIAALAGLDLDRAGVALEGGKPVLDAHLRSTTNPNILFAGDARGPGPQLSPVASYEGRLVAHNLLTPESPRAPDYDCIPSCVFTVPAVATVGRTERRAREDGVDLEVHENDLRSWLSARTYAETDAYSKILVDRASGRLVGAHLFGHGAQETIHAFALAMRHGLPASALKDMVYAYPTFHSDIRNQL